MVKQPRVVVHTRLSGFAFSARIFFVFVVSRVGRRRNSWMTTAMAMTMPMTIMTMMLAVNHNDCDDDARRGRAEVDHHEVPGRQ